ncbi:hypothetical protein [Aquamicrobium soli]|uniref:Arc family DNA-binding protein n=1 Tax=Aquamicrobium soli TaxID=1811518 RepID=A0ABV7KGB1_9HYPH
MRIEETRMTVRLPADAMRFLEQEAKADFTSKNAQIVRAIRAAMKAKGSAEVAPSPSHVTHQPR